jgi:hypothetical protein
MGDGRVTELTPNDVSFALSADAFSEVNHAMEAAMARKTAAMLGVPFAPRMPDDDAAATGAGPRAQCRAGRL